MDNHTLFQRLAEGFNEVFQSPPHNENFARAFVKEEDGMELLNFSIGDKFAAFRMDGKKDHGGTYPDHDLTRGCPFCERDWGTPEINEVKRVVKFLERVMLHRGLKVRLGLVSETKVEEEKEPF